MDIIPHKLCTSCGHDKPLSDFHKRADRKDGHATICKVCQSAYDRRPERMEKKREHWRGRYTHDPEFREDRKARTRHYYEHDGQYREATRQRAVEWAKEHRDQYNANARRRYQAYYGSIDRVRRQNNTYRSRKREWERQRLMDPAKKARATWLRRQVKNRRYVQIAQSTEHFTQQQWEDLCKHYGYRCLCCGEVKPLTVDHVVPLARGGSDGIDNIQPLCGSCNSSKNARHIDYRPLWEGRT